MDSTSISCYNRYKRLETVGGNPMQYEYEAEIRVEITEDDFVTNFGREPKNEAEWNAYCDKLIDDTYDAVETIKESISLPNDDWKVV